MPAMRPADARPAATRPEASGAPAAANVSALGRRRGPGGLGREVGEAGAVGEVDEGEARLVGREGGHQVAVPARKEATRRPVPPVGAKGPDAALQRQTRVPEGVVGQAP